MLHLRTFLVRERVGMFKLVDHYDIFDPDTSKQIGHAVEEVPAFTKFARLVIDKRFLPTTIAVYEEGEREPLFTISRGMYLFRSRVEVRNAGGTMIGYFKSKLFSLGGGFYVYDKKDRQFAEVKGDWKGWNFKLLAADGSQLGTVAKKWAGIAKELFTTADNYVIALSDGVEENETSMMLLLATGLAIDTVFKENA